MKKNLFFAFLFSLFLFVNTNAFDVKIDSSEKEININDTFSLKIEVDLWNSKEVQINEIKWLENFQTISSSTSQSSSYKTQIINWETKKVSKQISYISLILKPLEKWDFYLWPVLLSDWTEKKESNSLKIQVSWDKKSAVINDFEKKLKWNDKYKNDFWKDHKIWFTAFLILFFILFFLLALSFFTYKYFSIIKKDIIDLFYKKKKEEINTDFISFEKEKVTIYPDLEDKDFIEKTEKILKTKLKIKYNLSEFKTLQEALNLLSDDLSDKETLVKITDLLNKLKYSNILISKVEILDLVKKI